MESSFLEGNELITSSVKAQQVVKGFIQLQSINLFSGTGIQTELKIFMPRLNGKDFDYASFASDLRSILDGFVLNKKTIKKYIEEENYMELSLQARNKFRDVYVNNGELGELILYTFLEGNLRAPKILSKMSLKTSNNMFVNGADGVHLLKISESNYHLIFGEAKMYAVFLDGFKAACKSLKEFIGNSRMFELNLIDSQLENEILDQNDVELISKIIYPSKSQNIYTVVDSYSVFVGFQIDIPDEKLYLSDEEYNLWIKDEIEVEIKKASAKMEDAIKKYSLIGKNFYLYVMPFIKIDETRKNILKEVVE